MRGELADLQEKSDALTARWKAEKDKLGQAAKLKEELDAARNALAQAQRKGDYAEAGRLTYGTIPELEKKLAGGGEPGQQRAGRRSGDREPRRPGRVALDGRSRRQDARRRARETPQDGGGDRAPRRWAARGGGRGLDRGPARPRWPAGPEPADRLVHVPGPNRRRQDGAHQGARVLPVRRRERARAHRHVRVHGEALGRPAHRRASRLCRLRGRRSVDRSGAAPALSGRAVRRDREGASGRVQRPVAGARRRAAHRRSGAHGRFPQRAHHHDLQPRLRISRQSCARARTRRRSRRK